MRDDGFDSKLMVIEVVGSTIRYAYRDDLSRAYEIRSVSSWDLAKLRQTIGDKRYSSSATVQLLTHTYSSSHFHADGSHAPPCRTSRDILIKLTPFA